MLPRIIVGFHSFGTCPTQFAMDLARAMRYSGTLVPFAIHEQSCYVDSSRNKLVRNFLSIPAEQATHLLMVDVDISFQADAFAKTFFLMESSGSDVLYGNYALGDSGNSIFGSPENSSEEASVLAGFTPNKIYNEIATGGTGWVIMKRSVLERMQKECPGPWHWFARDLTSKGDDLRGEDVSFGLRLWDMKPRPVVKGTTALLLRHLKLQPFIPEHMQSVARELGETALAFPNPFEADKEKYEIVGNQVVCRTKLEEVEGPFQEVQNAGEEQGPAEVLRSRGSSGQEGAEDENGAEAPKAGGVGFDAPELAPREDQEKEEALGA